MASSQDYEANKLVNISSILRYRNQKSKYEGETSKAEQERITLIKKADIRSGLAASFRITQDNKVLTLAG